MGNATYEGETRLAIGGMAEVLMAVERTATGVPCLVVLKRLLDYLADDPQTVEDFLSEARMMVALHHPNIVTVRNLGRDSTGFFIVQEYLSGEDLRRMMSELARQKTTMPLPIACRIAAEVAAALQYSHRASDLSGQPMKLVHRDINPGNVIVTYDGRVKLIDFGVAKSALQMRNTLPGAFKGQPAYVSPETLRGDPVDHRADIFSLGVVLHEMLTGQSLFQREHPSAVLDGILNEPIPSTRDLNPQVPAALDALVMHAVERDPARRFPSAGQMREALEEILRKVNATVGSRQLGLWVQTSMADFRRVRIELEREVKRKAGVDVVRGIMAVEAPAKPPPLIAAAPPPESPWLTVTVASLLSLLLLLLVIVAFLIGRSAAVGPGTAGT